MLYTHAMLYTHGWLQPLARQQRLGSFFVWFALGGRPCMGWPVPALHNYLHLQARRAGAQSTKFTASCGAAVDDWFSKRASTVILRQCLVHDGSHTRRAQMRVERVLLTGVEHGGASNGSLHPSLAMSPLSYLAYLIYVHTLSIAPLAATCFSCW